MRGGRNAFALLTYDLESLRIFHCAPQFKFGISGCRSCWEYPEILFRRSIPNPFQFRFAQARLAGGFLRFEILRRIRAKKTRQSAARILKDPKSAPPSGFEPLFPE